MFLYKQFPVTISQDRCSKCKICLSICNCFSYDRNKNTISINYISCKGCGICVAACPSSAISHIYDDAFFICLREERLINLNVKNACTSLLKKIIQ